mmetsp:Transcript_32587/g.74982  ORF Transcript_32587/g.74982 Transcript_32587/m.74982 type:complete len:731 (-) Transcript_32587:534-2726(-)
MGNSPLRLAKKQRNHNVGFCGKFDVANLTEEGTTDPPTSDDDYSFRPVRTRSIRIDHIWKRKNRSSRSRKSSTGGKKVLEKMKNRQLVSESDASHPANNMESQVSFSASDNSSFSDEAKDTVSKLNQPTSIGKKDLSTLIDPTPPRRRRSRGDQIDLGGIISLNRAFGSFSTNIVHIERSFGADIESTYEGCHDGMVLGHGVQGIVRRIVHRTTGMRYALKRIELDHITNEASLKQLKEEIRIMCELDHPNIVRLEEVYEGQGTIYLVQELYVGGELYDQLDLQDDQHYTEENCRRLIKQMLSAVRYLHNHGIVHRDLKLENFLFSDGDGACLKLIDFGLSKHFSYPGEKFHDIVGTPYTVAPEVILGTHDEQSDLWSIGVIAYLLLSGDAPFGGCGGPEPLSSVRENILAGRFSFHPSYIWDMVSAEAKDFVASLLVIDPSCRSSAVMAQHHRWFSSPSSNQSKNISRIHPSVVQALLAFRNYSDMRRVLCEVLSFTMMPEQIVLLRDEFEKLDTEGTGEITLDGFRRVLLDRNGPVTLAEQDVRDVFDALRVCKKETTVHYREFIAAGLSQCRVDDRNLRLAFERLDSDHKGFLDLRNFLDMLGKDVGEGSVRSMFADGLKVCQCREQRLYYEDFLKLMKGQTKDSGSEEPLPVLESDEKLAAVSEVHRAHVMMRHAVMEASRRFDEKMKTRMSLSPTPPGSEMRKECIRSGHVPVGVLVMRRDVFKV